MGAARSFRRGSNWGYSWALLGCRARANLLTRLTGLSSLAAPILLTLPLHRWRIRVLVASSGPSVSPKAKGNGSPDRERDHRCVPQSHGIADELFISQRTAI